MEEDIILYHKHNDKEYCIVKQNENGFLIIKYKNTFPYDIQTCKNIENVLEMFMDDIKNNRLKNNTIE